jgi:RNA polymerase sigma-70 factor (ECF subfamily)
MDHLKKQKRFRFDNLEATSFDQIDTDDIELENKILKDIQLDQLELLFKELKSDDKMVLLMRYQDGMSVKQISSTLQVGQSAIKMRLKRSRDRLAELLKDAQDEA